MPLITPDYMTPQPKPSKPTRQDVIELSRNNPTVYAGLAYWRRGELTFEEALIVIVSTQSNQVDALQNELKTLLENSSQPVIMKRQ